MGDQRHIMRLPGIMAPQDYDVKQRSVPKLSVGRHTPITPQSLIVATVKLDASGVPRSTNPMKNELLFAPVSNDKQVYTPKRGEWAMSLVDPLADRFQAPASSACIPGFTIFTAMNGISQTTKLRFAGMIDNAADLDNPNRDDVGTLRMSGTCTGINTGGSPIPQGSMVYANPISYVITDHATGRKIPGVHIIGEPKEKCFIATVAIEDTDVHAFQAFVTEAFKTLFSKRSDSYRDEVTPTIKNKLYIIEECPLYDWTHLEAAHVAMLKSLDHQYIHYAISQVNALYNKQTEMVKHYNDALGTHYGDQREEQDDSIAEESFESEFKNYDEDAEKFADFPSDNEEFTRAVMDVCRQLERCKNMCTSAYMDYLQRFAIGTAITSAESAGNFDCIMGFRAC